MSKLLVFDVDGTILNSWGGYERVVMDYSQERGLPRPCFETIKKGYGNAHAHDFGWGVGRDEQWQHMLETFRIAERHEMSGDPRHTPQLFDGAGESLIHLKDLGHTLAIITSKAEAPLLHLLEHHKIARLFSAHRSINDVTRRGEKEKPAPDMLHSVMRELGFAPEGTVMVGDTTMDVRMGRAADAHTIGVTWGTHPKEYLADAGAHHIVETVFGDVVRTVKGIFG
ncbi:MAG: HAD family hydrolase [Alphaproteobacteria bacterium]|nr:HAD family hydrolase [Alphaproteobacteria bacterium]